MKNILILLSLLLPLTTMAQNPFPNTLEIDSTSISPKANLEDISWIAGHWKGTAFGGDTEEIWSAPLGNSMMGSFKIVIDNEIQFYELMTISEENGTLMLRILHFDKSLNGWEEQGHPEEFPLVKISPNKVFFDGLTFEKISKKKINIYVIIDDEKQGTEEMNFPYKKRGKIK